MYISKSVQIIVRILYAGTIILKKICIYNFRLSYILNAFSYNKLVLLSQ